MVKQGQSVPLVCQVFKDAGVAGLTTLKNKLKETILFVQMITSSSK